MDSIYQLELAPVFVVLLISVRLGALFMMNPIVDALSMPISFRILFVLMLAVALSSGLSIPALNVWHIVKKNGIFTTLITEMVIGGTMSIGTQIAFAAIEMGGRILDIQIGYGMAQVYDPALRRQMPFLTSALSQFGVLVFLCSDSCHTILRGVNFSLASLPPGQNWAMSASLVSILQHAGSLFSLGFILVAPVIFCMLLLEFGLAMLARTVPQLHIFSFNHSARIVVGVSATSLLLLSMPQAIGRIYQTAFLSWEKVFANG